MTLEQAIEHAAEHLPDGWQARITVENGSGYVEAVRPDYSEVGMDDADCDLVDQVLAVVRLARDEIAADKISEANAIGDSTLPANGQPESKNEQDRG